jgi:hypothetical protein
MMKTTFAASLLIATFLTASNPVRAQDDRPKTPLSEQMTGIAKDFRALRKMVSDPAQKDAALKLVKDMEDRAAKAKGFDPAKAKEIAPADRDQFIANYRKSIDGLTADFQTLEGDVTDGKTADASALLDKIQADKREGHKKFHAEDENGPGGHRPPPAKPAQTGSNG